MDMADGDGAADLCIGCTQFAVLVMRQRLIMRLLGKHMRDAVRDRPLLREQQGKDKE